MHIYSLVLYFLSHITTGDDYSYDVMMNDDDMIAMGDDE